MKKRKLLRKRRAKVIKRNRLRSRKKAISTTSAKPSNKPFINSLQEEIDLAPRGFDLEDLDPKPKRILRIHPVVRGRSPHFYFILRGKKSRKDENVPEPVNRGLIKLAKKKKKEFIGRMEKNMGLVREFLAFIIGPKMLPLISSVEEARDILQEITGEEVNSTIYSILMRHASHAAEIKIASFISKYLALDEPEQQQFAERLFLEKQSTYDLLKMQKMGAMQRSGEGKSGVQLQEVPSVQRRHKNRRSKGIQ